MSELTLTIVEPTPSLNRDNPHWSSYHKLKSHWRMLVLEALSKQKKIGWRPPVVKARVVVERVGKGMLDKDNLYGGVKPLIDALKGCYLIQDDNAAWIELYVQQRKIEKGELPHSIVTLTWS